MRHILFQENPENIYKTAVLIKDTAFNRPLLEEYYVTKMVTEGIPKDSIIGFSLKYNEHNKAPAKLIKEYLDTVLRALDQLQVTTLLVADANYFKTLTKERKAEPHYGYVKSCKIDGYEHMDIILVPNYQALFHNPAIKDRLDMGVDTCITHLTGDFVELGQDIVHTEHYPDDLSTIKEALASLHNFPELTCDIEAFSLMFQKAGIGTIAFAWDEHNGLGFEVDYKPRDPGLTTLDGLYGDQVDNQPVKELLKEFFLTYTGKLTYHNGCYDIKVLIYELFMNDLLDTEGLLHGLDVLYQNIDDTKIITYLATNTTAGNKLGLKHAAFEYTGNYAQDDDDIKDIRRIPIGKLLRYNLIDCLATWFVYKKNYPIMVQDEQQEIYEEIMLPSMKVITQMELTGMPMDMEQILITEKELKAIVEVPKQFLRNSSLIRTLEWNIQRAAMQKKNAELKTKVRPLSDFKATFNPGSNQQVQHLLYDQFQLPVIDYTNTKQPATGKDTLKKLRAHLERSGRPDIDDKIKVINALIEISEVDKILNTFIKAFKERTILKADGCYYLHGNFNLGGTVSGRLSSSKPNLQNIPSNSKYAKHIKRCFISPPGWIMVGPDFSSLEDRISALTTKDPNKLKVYTGVIIYELVIDGTCHHIRDDDTINFDGKTYTGVEFYDTYRTL